MSKLKSSFKWQSFRYDFAVDGGAVSSIPMGIFMPVNCQLLGIALFQVTVPTSGGGGNATIDIGLLGGTTVEIIDNATSGATGNFQDYDPATWGFGITLPGQALPGIIPTTTTLVKETTARQVIVSIGTDPLTAGAFTATIYYNEF